MVSQVLLTIGTAYGAGNHKTILEAHGTLIPALKYVWIAQMIVLAAIGFGKVGVICFILFVQGTTHPRMGTALKILAELNVSTSQA